MRELLGVLLVLGIAIAALAMLVGLFVFVVPVAMYFLQLLSIVIFPFYTVGGYFLLSKSRKSLGEDLELVILFFLLGTACLALAFGFGLAIEMANNWFEVDYRAVLHPWYIWIAFFALSHFAGGAVLWAFNRRHDFKEKERIAQLRLAQERDRARLEAEANQRYAEEMERVRGESERRRKAQQEYEKQQREEQEKRRKGDYSKHQEEKDFTERLSEAQALDFLGMKKPYTIEELKGRRMTMLKKLHPDQGGSNMAARLVNEAFDVLSSKI